MKKILLYIVIVMSLMSSQAMALEQGDKEQFIKNAKTYLLAHNMRTFNVVMQYVSPKVLETIAQDNKLSLANLTSIIPDNLRNEALKGKKTNYVGNFEKIESQELGTILVVTIPMNYDVVDKDGKNIRLKNQLIGMKTEGKWYFINSDELSLLDYYKKAYPELVNLKLAKLDFEFLDPEFDMKKGKFASP
ncbi:hypothetical protein [Bartonella choladocola]|uniref:Uncharacterized protein n=1 Tax=Bartonella choladocola TaxID=2750995 RepID=A0A1U9MJN6_9HYPH|nr:hypothetical protein [Bartonella choladocola]AQT47948.1 hypothetical protein BBC0122_018510 [Bartonella choladocola]